MYKNVLFFVCSVFITISSYSQKAPVKFGDVSFEELKMTRYDKDTSASALVLADYGMTSIVYQQGKGFQLKFERLQRIKIFKKDAYDFASREIPVYHNSDNEEKVQALKAVTYNLENGKVIESKMKSDASFKEKYDKNVNLIKFVLPNVKEGSVIEISYQILSDFIFNLQDWEFQSTIPTKWSEYRVAIPEYFNYEQYMQGYVKLAINESNPSSSTIKLSQRDKANSYDNPYGGSGINAGNSVHYQDVEFVTNNSRFVAKDIPAFTEEPLMNNLTDHISKINFELAYTKFPNSSIQNYTGTWKSLNQSFLDAEDFGQTLKGSNFLNDEVKKLTEGLGDPYEKASKICRYVKEHVRWNESYRKYAENSFRKILDEGKGNSADINLLLVSMLRKADLDASPVLISTRNHGRVRESFAVSSQFDYVICLLKIDQNSVLIDATDSFLPLNILPQRCLNGRGFVISEENPGWVAINPNVKSKTVTNGSFDLDVEGKLKGTLNFVKDGYDARSMRRDYIMKGEENYTKDIAKRYLWELEKSSFENITNLSSEIKEFYTLVIPDRIQMANDIYYFNPMLIQEVEENPFKSETREYPVDFGRSFEKTFSYKINLPAELVVDELPKPKIIVLPNGAGKYIYSAAQIGQTITFTSQLTISKAGFTQDEYSSLRQFFELAVAKQSEQIVLRKK